MEEHLRSLFGSVGTYAPVSTERVVGFLRRALEVVLPWVVEPEFTLALDVTRLGEDLERRKPARGVVWDQVPLDEPLENLAVYGFNGRYLPDEGPEVLQVSASFPTPNRHGVEWPTLAAFSVTRRSLADHRVAPGLQHQAVTLAKDTFAEFDAETGFVTVDFPTTTTTSPYELATGMSPWVWDFRRRVRGYYWGNLLNATQVGLLGGFEAVVREAPVAVVERVGGGCWLQLTDDVNAIDRDRLGRLRRFLGPLLPEGERTVEEFSGFPPYLV